MAGNTLPSRTHCFAEQVLTLLDEGAFSATYKYAVMLALIDLCLEGTGRTGTAPDMVNTRQLADKILSFTGLTPSLINWYPGTRYSGRIQEGRPGSYGHHEIQGKVIRSLHAASPGQARGAEGFEDLSGRSSGR